MKRLFSNFLIFMSPEDSGGVGAPDPTDGKSTIELLDETPEVLELPKDESSKEDDEESEDTEEETGESSTSEDDELKEIEEELDSAKKDGEEEDVSELMTPALRKDILTKYPKLFKDFPSLEKAYYREREYTEIFSTVNNAKEAASKARSLDQLENQVMTGDIAPILQAAKNGDQESFYRIADNYLPALKHVDQQAYYNVLGNVIKDTIVTMVKEGRALGEQGAPLQAAANILNQFVFGSQNFTPPTRLSRQAPPDEMQRQNQQVQQDRQRTMDTFTSVKDDLQNRADNVLRSTIEQNIDPRNSMTDYVRRTATRDAFETLEGLIDKDTRFHSLLDRLWERAFQQNFSKDSTDKIKSAYLSKAKTLLPSVIKKARNEALRGLGRRVSDSSTDDESSSEQEQTTTRKSASPSSNTTGRSTPPPRGKFKNAKDIPKEMSTLDVLMRG